MAPKYDTLHAIALIVDEGVDIARAANQTEEHFQIVERYANKLRNGGPLEQEARNVLLDDGFVIR